MKVSGRHRLGTPGLVHCVRHRAVAEALAEFQTNWLAKLITPARHSLAGLRRRAIAAERLWAIPATA